MRFQTSKVISVENPEIVLYALEHCLRKMFMDVVRDGTEIVFHGLGPSPRIVNPRDITVFRVETEHERTIIKADVTFQPSCLLGESPQNEIVLAKLDRVFERMHVEIPVEGRRESPTSRPPTTAPVVLVSDEFPSSRERAALIPPSPRVGSRAIREPSPERQSHGRIFDGEGAERTLSHRNPLLPNTGGLTPLTFAITILSLAFLALGIYVLPNSAINPSPSTNLHALTKPLGHDSPSDKRQHPTAAELLSVHSVADPHVWLENWVAAMRTRDPVFQASFYADPMDNYFGMTNISGAELIEDKKNEISDRNGLWTVKLEEIVLIRERDNGITVQLIKHYIVQAAPAQVSERFVRSRLRLKRLHGQWKIVAEDYLH